MEALRKASAFLFYPLGILAIALIIMARRGDVPESMSPLLHVLDLPLLFVAMVYGGSSLYVSLSKGKKSLPLLMGIAVPLGVLFLLLVWFNFAAPFAPTDF